MKPLSAPPTVVTTRVARSKRSGDDARDLFGLATTARAELADVIDLIAIGGHSGRVSDSIVTDARSAVRLTIFTLERLTRAPLPPSHVALNRAPTLEQAA